MSGCSKLTFKTFEFVLFCPCYDAECFLPWFPACARLSGALERLEREKGRGRGSFINVVVSFCEGITALSLAPIGLVRGGDEWLTCPESSIRV